jgi:hypothetical protein
MRSALNRKAGTGESALAPASDQKTALHQSQATRVPEGLVSRLNEPLPREAIAPHPSNPHLSSIKTIYQIERLNQVFGLGAWTAKSEIIENSRDTRMVVVKVRLQVPDWNIDLEQYGGNDNQDRGDAYKGAFTDALGKLCGYLGVGMDVYKGIGDSKSAATGRTRPSAKPVMIATEAAGGQPTAAPVETAVLSSTPHKYWDTVGEMRRVFQSVRERIGEVTYVEELEKWNVHSVEDFLKIRPAVAATQTAARCYSRMLQIAEQGAA